MPTKLNPAADDELVYSQAGAVATIIFNRAQTRNALTFDMYERLMLVCDGIPEDGSVGAVVITGAGDRAFAAGTDIEQFRGMETAADAMAYEALIESALGAVERCPVPTIAAMAGACTGGGAAIAAVCDLRLATEDLKFGVPVARTLGNCLTAKNLSRLCALIGEARVKDLIFTGRLVGSGEALAAGLVSEVLPDHAALMVRTAELAEQLVDRAPLSLRATKEALRRLRESNVVVDADLIEMCYTSADFREGVEAFLAKRKPTWRGR